MVVVAVAAFLVEVEDHPADLELEVLVGLVVVDHIFPQAVAVVVVVFVLLRIEIASDVVEETVAVQAGVGEDTVHPVVVASEGTHVVVVLVAAAVVSGLVGLVVDLQGNVVVAVVDHQDIVGGIHIQVVASVHSVDHLGIRVEVGCLVEVDQRQWAVIVQIPRPMNRAGHSMHCCSQTHFPLLIWLAPKGLNVKSEGE